MRRKLAELKKFVRERHLYGIIVAILAVVLAVTVYEYKRAADYRRMTENQYTRAFYDMKGYVDNVEILLQKSLLTTSPQGTAYTMQQTWREATLAQENLSQLPLEQPDISKASKFLIQVSDYANMLNRKFLYNEKITAAQYRIIERLYAYCIELNIKLNTLKNGLESGGFKWRYLDSSAGEVMDDTVKEENMIGIKDLETTFQDYPVLLYDGPFSDHITDIKPKYKGGKHLTQEEGQKKVEEIVGKDKIESVTFTGKDDSSVIKTYTYEIKYKGSETHVGNIEITQNGGDIYWMLSSRNPDDKQISRQDAINSAANFLKNNGYDDMKETYFIMEDGSITVNFAATQNDIVLYPDLINIKVALDNGEILGVQAKGYLYNNETREDVGVVFFAEKAEKMVSNKADVTGRKLVIIPTDFGTELLCHEIRCKMDEQEFLVYINAINGREEKIIMLMIDENGTLAV